MVTDLFGREVDLKALAERPMTAGNKPKRKPTVPHGYVYLPGTGPGGETCGSCKHIARIRFAKIYLKCELNKAKWTGGPGSDIRARSAACKFWEKPE